MAGENITTKYFDPRVIGPETKLIRETGGGRKVHSIDCAKILDWNAEGLEPIGKFNPKHMDACPVCACLVYPMAGAKDYEKNRLVYRDIYTEYSVRAETLEKLYYGRHAKTQINGNRIYITTRGERWEIELCGEGKVRLWHGNYKVDIDDRRIVMPGFHEHDLRKGTLDEAIRGIAEYRYEEARIKHRKNRDRLQKKKKTVREILEELEREGELATGA